MSLKAKIPPFRFITPDYCQHYQPLLVEDFALNLCPLLLHYGKCAVIGRTMFDPDTNRMYLGSIRLTGLSRQYQCPDGSNRVALLSTSSLDHRIPANKTIVVYGEAMLHDNISHEESQEKISLLSSSKDLMLSIGQLQIDLEAKFGLPERRPSGLTDGSLKPFVRSALYNEVEKMSKRFEPILSVHSYRLIDQPHSLISANLRLALVRKQRKATRRA